MALCLQFTVLITGFEQVFYCNISNIDIPNCYLKQLILKNGSSHPQVFCKIGFLKSFVKFTKENTSCRLQSLLLIKRLQQRSYPGSFAKFSRKPFIQKPFMLLEKIRVSRKKWNLCGKSHVKITVVESIPLTVRFQGPAILISLSQVLYIRNSFFQGWQTWLLLICTRNRFE